MLPDFSSHKNRQTRVKSWFSFVYSHGKGMDV
jgi:hypothetical protein